MNKKFGVSLQKISLTLVILGLGLTGEALANSVLVQVSPEDYTKIEDIEAQRVINYKTFVFVEVSPAQFKEIVARGVEIRRQIDPNSFLIQDRRIETTSPEPPVIQSAVVNNGASSFFLIQLIGPAKDEWLRELNAAGIETLRVYSPFVYLAKMSSRETAAVNELDFVRWIGPYLPEYRISSELLTMSGLIENVDVSILAESLDATLAAIEALGGKAVDRDQGVGNDGFVTVTFVLPASAVEAVSQLGGVSWLSFRPPLDPTEDEMSAQIISGNFGPITTGYQTWLASNGVNGNGVTIALIDTGYDTGVDGTAHADVSGRTIMLNNPIDNSSGHGTHVGGIMIGNASLGSADNSGFLLGLGVAPQATMVVRNFAGTDADRQSDAVTNGAVASNNSYGVNDAGTGYSARDSALDGLVRDADQSTAALDPLTIVFSAGNSGATGPTKNAKNIIAVGNSLNERNGSGSVNTGVNIDSLAGGSSRGPAADGRLYPHVSAPGSNIVSSRTTQLAIPAPPPPPRRSCVGVATGGNAPAASPTYSPCSGTSMAAPHVTGSVALITQWWRVFNGGTNPSPAMNKALLVNGAVDMDTADIPNNNEGWGRINLANVINTGIPTEYNDQATVFGSTGNSWTDNFSPADLGQPVRVTVAWTDAPAAGGANPALVNDIDLVVTDASSTFRGNVFANGFSTTGGSADTLNNLENVYLQNPVDAFTVTIIAAGINGDGIPGNGDTTDQDFALVCTNCVPNEPPVCDAGGPYVAECSVDIGLDGTGSSDPDSDPLTYLWSGPIDGSPVAGATPTVRFPSPTGAKSISLEVNDGLATDFCAAPVTVQDTLDPTITVPADITAECTAPEGTPVDIGLAMATDICDASPAIANDAPALFPLGMTAVTWTATDDDGNSDMDIQTITIEDTTPPEITVLEVSPDSLWPPNHKYVTVTATVEAVDVCDASPIITLVSVTSNEPEDDTGDGATVNDIVIIDDFTVELRAERSGNGSGRIYTLTYQAEDGSGNTTQAQAVVTVQKSRGE